MFQAIGTIEETMLKEVTSHIEELEIISILDFKHTLCACAVAFKCFQLVIIIKLSLNKALLALVAVIF